MLLRSVIAAVFIGLLGGLWIALLNGSIEIFENYVDGVWRYQVAVNSAAEVLVGVVIGALVGANIRLALAPERTEGFVVGAAVGAGVGGLLVLFQVVFVALAANFGNYPVNYQSLLARFSGIVVTAAISGAIAGLLGFSRPLVAPVPAALIGVLTAISFVLSGTILLTLNISGTYQNISFGEFAFIVLSYEIYQLVILLAGAICGAIVGAVGRALSADRNGDKLAFTGIIVGTVVAVTASSLSFLYILNLALPYPTSALATIPARLAVGLLCGTVVGLLPIALKTAATRPNPDMISPD